MRVRLKADNLRYSIELSEAFIEDVLPLLDQGGKADCWTLEQRQTFNSLAGRLRELNQAMKLIDTKT